MQTNFGQTISVLSPNQQIAVSRFVTKTYGWMTLGLLLTGLVSFYIANSEAAVTYIFGNSWIFTMAIVAEFAVVLGLTFALPRISATTATLGFLFYSLLNGVTFSAIFLIYTMNSIAQVFFVTSAMFGGLAIYGTVTKKDLTGIGSFVGMGLWGLILVGLVNMFVRSESLSLGLSAAGVIIFSGLAAYDAQRIRAMALQSVTSGGAKQEAQKGAIIGALMLYLDFINLFLSLLRLFGSRRS